MTHFPSFVIKLQKRALTVATIIWTGVTSQISCAGAIVATPVQLQAALNTNAQASVVGLCGLDVNSCPQIPMSQTFNGGKLIFSDSPESPDQTGILYMDTKLAATAVSLPNRVFVYHVNNNSHKKMKFSVLIRNNGVTNATLTILRAGIAGPGPNYAVVGQTAFYRWLTNHVSITLTMAPGQTERLDTNFDAINVRPGDLVNGIWDYTFNQPHTVIVCVLGTHNNPVTAGPALHVLARDGHVRGTFAACNKAYDASVGTVIDTGAGIQQFAIAGDGDMYETGFDNAVFPPTLETNGGNYGLLYNIQLNVSSSDARTLGILICPRGGPWCGAINADPGLLPGGAFLIPSTGAIISSSTNAAVAGEYLLKHDLIVRLQFMPTGASFFPISVMTVPFYLNNARHRCSLECQSQEALPHPLVRQRF